MGCALDVNINRIIHVTVCDDSVDAIVNRGNITVSVCGPGGAGTSLNDKFKADENDPLPGFADAKVDGETLDVDLTAHKLKVHDDLMDEIFENSAHRVSDGKDHSDVVLNNAHRVSDGTDHSDVVDNTTAIGILVTAISLNTTHRGSDGTDHANVVLNDTHRADVSTNPHNVTADQVDALKRDGSNANSDIDISSYNFTTTGAGFFNRIVAGANVPPVPNPNKIVALLEIFTEDGSAAINITSVFDVCSGASVEGFSVPRGNIPTGKNISGLNFGTFVFDDNLTGGGAILRGINVFASGGFLANLDYDTSAALNIENISFNSTGGKSLKANKHYGIKHNAVTNIGAAFGGYITELYGGYIDLDTLGDDNYQFVLDKIGPGSGLFLGGISGIRLFASSTELLEIDKSLKITTDLVVAEKAKITAIGGFAVKLTNRTGANTIAGQLVAPDTGDNDSFVTTGADSQEVVGIILDAGVANGAEAWVVSIGKADVLMDAGGSSSGDRIISSSTPGSADVWNVGGATAIHFQEIGHCLETRAGAGLARCTIHLN